MAEKVYSIKEIKEKIKRAENFYEEFYTAQLFWGGVSLGSK